jgi:hypothetical protein
MDEMTPDKLVELHCLACVSSLVHEIARESGDEPLALAACELYQGPIDCEECVWQEIDDDMARDYLDYEGFDTQDDDNPKQSIIEGDLAEDCCEYFAPNQCDPSSYQRDVCEHWIVTDWLARKLADKGETVDMDFWGLCIWARTTTGQVIALDDIMIQIVEDMTDE